MSGEVDGAEPLFVMKPIGDDPDETPSKATEKARERLSAAREATAKGADAVGRSLAPLAASWKQADDRRNAQRTPENLQQLRDATVQQRDAMRDLRRDRKAFEKARSEVQWWNVFNGERRAARAVVKDTRAMAKEVVAERRAAKAAYPMSLPQLAIRCHAAHTLPTGVWAAVSDHYLATGAFGLSLAAVALNVAAVKLGMRHVAEPETGVADDPLQPSQEESDLLQRLEPYEWMRFAEPRGLSQVVSAGATLTESGVQAKLTLNGTMDVPTLRGKANQLRAALRLREGTRMEIREGKTGGHARLTLRTRSAADHIDMLGWWPGAPWAVGVEDGAIVEIPLGKRMLVAGSSGSGKSWSVRPLLAEASERPDHRVVIIDRKYVEARNWQHRARTACEMDDIRDICDELTAEGEERLATLPRGQDVIEISESRPRIVVFVDEGAETLADSKVKYTNAEGKKEDFDDVIESLRTIARKYRAAEIILVWATQKPALSGDSPGLDSQISGQMTIRLSLAVATATESRVVFGDDASEKGWNAHELPMPGYALMKDLELGPRSKPRQIRMRAMSPKDVIALPDRPIWSRKASSTGATARDVAIRKAIEEAPTLRTPRVAAVDRDDQIMEALRATPGSTIAALAKATGNHRQTVSRSLDRLANDGLVSRNSDGCFSPVERD